MPFSIPTVLAVNFVTKRPLQQRMKALRRSYQIQFTGFSTLAAINIASYLKPLTTLNHALIKTGGTIPV